MRFNIPLFVHCGTQQYVRGILLALNYDTKVLDYEMMC